MARIRLAPLLLVVVALLTPAPADAGKRKRERTTKKERAAQLADPFSDESLQAFYDEIAPLVEEVGGRSFDKPVAIQLTDSERFGEVLREESRLIYDQVFRDSPEAIRASMSESAGRVPTLGLLGKYAMFDDTLYLSRPAIEAAAVQAGLPEHRIPDIVRLILAHELAHGLHDDEADLERIVRGLDDLDGLRAASGMWEGLAQWIEERVAERLELMDVYDALIGLQGWSRTGARDPASYPVWALYGVGRDFIAHHHAEGGFDRVWTIAASPPPRSAVIFRPDAWGEDLPATEVDYADVLRGTEQKLTRGDWLIANTTLGEYDLRGEAVRADNLEALTEILGHLEAARVLRLERPDRQGEIRLLDFDAPSWAERYLDLMKDQETALSTNLATALDTELEVIWTPFDEIEAEDATLRRVTLPEVGGTRLERHQAWVRRQDIVVVVSADDFRPGLRLGWTVEAVFERLDGPAEEPDPTAP